MSSLSVNSVSLSRSYAGSSNRRRRYRSKPNGGGVTNTDLQQIHNELTRIDLLEHDHQTLKQTVNQQSMMRFQVEELNRAKEDMQRQVTMLLRQIQSLEAVPDAQTV